MKYNSRILIFNTHYFVWNFDYLYCLFPPDWVVSPVARQGRAVG